MPLHREWVEVTTRNVVWDKPAFRAVCTVSHTSNGSSTMRAAYLGVIDKNNGRIANGNTTADHIYEVIDLIDYLLEEADTADQATQCMNVAIRTAEQNSNERKGQSNE